MSGEVMPDALRRAACGCDDPKWLGEILIALCGGPQKGLDKGQLVVLGICRAEIGERAARRAEAAARKRRWRGGTEDDVRQGDLFEGRRKGARK